MHPKTPKFTSQLTKRSQRPPRWPLAPFLKWF